MKNLLSLSDNKADYLLSFIATMQPVLVLIQLFMIDALQTDPERANHMRVLFTAAPILLSFPIILKRIPRLTFCSYGIVLLVILYTLCVWPERWIVMKSELLRFTLPTVIPIGLCIAAVNSFPILIRCLKIIAILSASIGILYMVYYYQGGFDIEGYSISFSYALLVPTFVFLSRSNILWKIIAGVLMIIMIAIGSRGAFLVATAYALFSYFWGKRPLTRILVYAFSLFMVIYFLFEPAILILIELFKATNIDSRTLELFLSNELLTHDSGRGQLYEQAWGIISQNEFWGAGIWADRAVIGTYCHNIFLELMVDFGVWGAAIIIIVFAFSQVKLFFNIPSNHKSMYIMMLGCVVPLFVSSSYLISYNLSMYLGFTFFLYKIKKQGLYQYVQFDRASQKQLQSEVTCNC